MRAWFVATAPLLLAASAGLAQTQWNNAGGGQWNAASNWDPTDVPDIPGESAQIDLAGTYTVTIQSIDPSIDSLLVTNPGATVGLLGARTLTLGGGMVNDGLFIVDYNGGASVTTLDFLADALLAGSGRVRLNQLGDRARLTTSTGATLTNGSSHTIEGAGRIYASLVNDGVVSANVGSWTMELLGADKTNNGRMEAVGGGELQLGSIVISQGPVGAMRADGGFIRTFSGSVPTIENGTIETPNGGVAQVYSGGDLTLEDVALAGQLDIHGGGMAHITGSSLANSGLIRVDANQSASVTVLDFASPVAITGPGTIRLFQLDDRAQMTTSNGDTVTQGADHRIEGAGRIYASLVNDGVVSANIGSWPMGLLGADKTNNGLMEALGGGILELDSVAVRQGPGGVMRADGGFIRTPGASVSTIENGTIETPNGGVVQVYSGGDLTLEDVALTGQLDIYGGGTIHITGSSLANSGLIRVDANQSTSVTVLDFASPVAISGAGTIRLFQLGDRAQMTTSNGDTVTQGADHRIEGAGRIYASLINNGVVSANIGAWELELLGADKTNNGLIEAVDSGLIDIVEGRLSQGPSGVLRADSGRLRFPGGSTAQVVGGAIEAVNGGVVEVLSGAAPSLEAVEIRDSLDINGNGAVGAAGAGFTNSGLITVNSNGSSSVTTLTFLDTGTIDGAGEIRLAQVAARSTITSEPGVVGTIGAGQRVTGRGKLGGELVMQGTLAPGLSIDTITLDGGLAMAPAGVYEVEIESTGSYDKLTGTGGFTAGGTLRILAGGSYTPAFGHSFTIVSVGAVDGRFGVIDGPPLPNGWIWRVRYEPNKAVLVVSCPADFNIDGGVNTLDVLAFLNAWTAGDSSADMNGDGNVNTLDVLAFLNLWTAGC